MADKFVIQGAKEMHDALKNLPVKMERNILRGAMRAGARVIMLDARARVPVKTGLLRDSIRVSSRVRQGVVTTRVAAGSRKKGGAWYAHLVEFGTKAHVILAGGGTKKGKALAAASRILGVKVDHPGARAKPFMRPALDTKARGAIDAARDYIARRLDKLTPKG